jgi:predicted acyl esterase
VEPQELSITKQTNNNYYDSIQLMLDNGIEREYVKNNREGDMPRKQQTEAEKAQTLLQEELAGYAPTVKALETCVGAIKLYHKLSHRDAICALRDYFQWLLAAESDKAMAESQERVRELKSKLGETA